MVLASVINPNTAYAKDSKNVQDVKIELGYVRGDVIVKNTVEKDSAYSVSISREGLAKLNEHKSETSMGVQKLEEYKSVLEKAQIDVSGTIEADFHHR